MEIKATERKDQEEPVPNQVLIKVINYTNHPVCLKQTDSEPEKLFLLTVISSLSQQYFLKKGKLKTGETGPK